MAENWAESLSRGLKRKLEDPEDSELTVKVGNTEYKVYKLVFCTLSKFFEKAVKNFKEAETGVVELKHGDERLLHHLVTWFKTGEICNGEVCRLPKKLRSDTEPKESTTEPEDNNGWDPVPVGDRNADVVEWSTDQKCHHPIAFDVAMFALADFYDIKALRDEVIGRVPAKVQQILPYRKWGLWSEDTEAEDPEDVEVLARVEDFCAAIRQTYSSTPDCERDLRKAIATEAVDRLKRLYKYECFVDVLSEVIDFNKTVVGELGDVLQNVIKVCARCGKRCNNSPCPCSAPAVPEHQMNGHWQWIKPHERVVETGGGWGDVGHW